MQKIRILTELSPAQRKSHSLNSIFRLTHVLCQEWSCRYFLRHETKNWLHFTLPCCYRAGIPTTLFLIWGKPSCFLYETVSCLLIYTTGNQLHWLNMEPNRLHRFLMHTWQVAHLIGQWGAFSNCSLYSGERSVPLGALVFILRVAPHGAAYIESVAPFFTNVRVWLRARLLPRPCEIRKKQTIFSGHIPLALLCILLTLVSHYSVFLSVRGTDTNVLNSLKYLRLSCKWRRIQNNVTHEWGECTTMREEYDPKNWFSLFLSHYSLHSQQWKQGITWLCSMSVCLKGATIYRFTIYRDT